MSAPSGSAANESQTQLKRQHRWTATAVGATAMSVALPSIFAAAEKWIRIALIFASLTVAIAAANTARRGAVAQGTRREPEAARTGEGARASDHTPTRIRVRPLSLGQFLSAISTPEKITLRIKESVTPLTRAYAVRTQYTLKVDAGPEPPKQSSDDILFIPLMWSKKGQLHDDLSFHLDGSEIPTLPFEVTSRMVTLALAARMADYGAEVYSLYKEIEPEIVRRISSRPSPPSGNVASSLHPEHSGLPKERDTSLDRGLQKLPASEAGVINQVLAVLARDYVIVAAVPRRPSGFYVIESTERHIVPATPLPGEGQLNLLASLRHRFARIFGIRPATITYPVVNATRTESYHAEIMGEAGSYLSRQRFDPADGSWRFCGFRERSGQRYSHLYLRGFVSAPQPDRTGSLDPTTERPFANLSVDFHERTPGAYLPATGSAFITLLVTLCAWNLPETVRASTDIMALLLAAPGAVSALIALNSPGAAYGGSFGPRLSHSLAFLVSTIALPTYLLGQSPQGDPLWQPWAQALWPILVSLGAANLALISVAWFNRASVYNYFYYRE